jgi:hypothetical protein
LRFGEPHRRASYGPHPVEEKSIVPPRQCCVLLHAQRRSETECLFKEVIDDGLDDDDPFFLVKRIVVSSMVAALSLTNKYPGFSTGNKVHKYYFGVWTLSGIRMCFVEPNKRDGWLSLRWF